MRIEVAREIAAPPAAVFATIIDIPRWPEVMPAIKRIDIVTPGPIAVGTRFRRSRVMHGRPAKDEMTVTTLEPPRRLVLTAESYGVRYIADYILDAAPRGTRLVLMFEGHPVTLLAKLLTPLTALGKAAHQLQLEADIAHIAAAAERRAAGAA